MVVIAVRTATASVPGAPSTTAVPTGVRDVNDSGVTGLEVPIRDVEAMLEYVRRGAYVFDYGNNLRGEAADGGVTEAFSYPGFVPAYIRPLFCRGVGPFRWAALTRFAAGSTVT